MTGTVTGARRVAGGMAALAKSVRGVGDDQQAVSKCEVKYEVNK